VPPSRCWKRSSRPLSPTGVDAGKPSGDHLRSSVPLAVPTVPIVFRSRRNLAERNTVAGEQDARAGAVSVRPQLLARAEAREAGRRAPADPRRAGRPRQRQHEALVKRPEDPRAQDHGDGVAPARERRRCAHTDALARRQLELAPLACGEAGEAQRAPRARVEVGVERRPLAQRPRPRVVLREQCPRRSAATERRHDRHGGGHEDRQAAGQACEAPAPIGFPAVQRRCHACRSPRQPKRATCLRPPARQPRQDATATLAGRP